MEKRAFLAVFLSALVFILYQYFYLSKIDTTQIKPKQIKDLEQSAAPKSPIPPQTEILVKEESKVEERLIKEREIKINKALFITSENFLSAKSNLTGRSLSSASLIKLIGLPSFALYFCKYTALTFPPLFVKTTSVAPVFTFISLSSITISSALTSSLTKISD